MHFDAQIDPSVGLRPRIERTPGKAEGKLCALARFALDPDPSAVELDETLGDGKPEAGASLLAGRRPEAVEDLLDRVGLDAWSLIDDRKADAITLAIGAHHDRSAFGTELDGVAHQVLEHLENARGVAPGDDREVAVSGEVDLLLSRDRQEVLEGRIDELGGGVPGDLETDLGALETRLIEELRDQRHHARRRPLDGLDALSPERSFRIFGGEAFEQYLCAAKDDHEGIAQIVRDDREDLFSSERCSLGYLERVTETLLVEGHELRCGARHSFLEQGHECVELEGVDGRLLAVDDLERHPAEEPVFADHALDVVAHQPSLLCVLLRGATDLLSADGVITQGGDHGREVGAQVIDDLVAGEPFGPGALAFGRVDEAIDDLAEVRFEDFGEGALGHAGFAQPSRMADRIRTVSTHARQRQAASCLTGNGAGLSHLAPSTSDPRYRRRDRDHLSNMARPEDLSLRQLQYVVAVADTLGFHKAAARTHVSQPTLSAQLAQIESVLGVKLFERDKRRVMVTVVGADIVERARRILVEVEDLIAAATRSRDPFTGTLRIGVIPTIAPYLLPEVMPAIQARYPKLSLVFREEKTEDIVRDISEGQLEAGIVALEAPLGALAHSTIAVDPFVVAMPKGHGLARKKRLSLDDLEGERVLLLDEGHCLRDQALSLCARADVDETSFRATSLSTLAQMVSAGSGITLLPSLALEVENRRGQLVIRPFTRPSPHRTLALVWRPLSPLGDALKELSKTLRAVKPPSRPSAGQSTA